MTHKPSILIQTKQPKNTYYLHVMLPLMIECNDLVFYSSQAAAAYRKKHLLTDLTIVHQCSQEELDLITDAMREENKRVKKIKVKKALKLFFPIMPSIQLQ